MEITYASIMLWIQLILDKQEIGALILLGILEMNLKIFSMLLVQECGKMTRFYFIKWIQETGCIVGTFEHHRAGYLTLPVNYFCMEENYILFL